ncbi:amine oxidoreductase [Hymenobacter aquaticus]|uniref:Tryptophan 2-monooxygenase n=1 Tax=Hymenobacter aquaticus TaxID=1867101 RepID=A0A4Z0PXS4_9BACT|nr:FAD-dependent oxidoreductase [Hymenobacter aquaticus]TGE22265.1 amine oxidoreductase [Hymenobacter aquaticus]
MNLDVAVIGGGVSGAYSAWRLQQENGGKARVALFEYSNRIGGRLYSVTIPGLPHVKAEVGGMRYIPESHVTVASLIDHLALPTENFPMGAPAPVGANCNLYYLRGKHLRLHELSDPAKVPYNLAWSERGLGPTNLQVQVMNSIYPGMSNLSLSELMQINAFGKPMWKYGFWNLMYRTLSSEGYQFMKDAGGYDANVANANAVTQLPATEYSDQTQFLTLRDGYDQLPITLVKQFNDTFDGAIPKGQRVHMNHRLAEIVIGTGEYPYTLHFEPTETDYKQCTVVQAAAERITVRAKKVILGLPRRSLELIKSSFFDDAELKKNMGSVLIQSAFKLFLAYERPWWRALGLVSGRSVTDLPVRQVFYFGTEAEQPQGLPYMNSLLMASYNDISTVPFWKGLEKGKEYPGYMPACIEPGVTDVIPDMEFRATDEMVQAANRQVAEVHALPEIPMPYSAVYHSWNEDPYGGGWHEWKANYRLDQIMHQMLKPVADQDIHIVGEAYSYDQGWVEGSLDTAEAMLQKYFQLDPPSWLPEAAYPLLPEPNSTPSGGDTQACIPYSKATADKLKKSIPNCLTPIQPS